MSKRLLAVITALLLVSPGLARAADITAPTGANQPADPSAKDPSGNVGRPGGSSSSVNTPTTGEPTGTGTPNIAKQPDTHDNGSRAPAPR